MAKTTWQRYLVFLGAVVAIVGQFWGYNYYLPLIGGVIALVFALLQK